jgi:(p)ppGpp synthase/HD superfamily hydrolase
MDYRLILKCSEYAAIAHMGQYRKDGKTPYIVHPARVSSLVSMSNANQDVSICSAWLHDVLEDCTDKNNLLKNYVINHKDTFENFLESLKEKHSKSKVERIQKVVTLLTMDQNETISKKDRKNEYYNNLKNMGSEQVIVIKFCDRIDNLITASSFKQEDFKWYLSDTKDILTRFGNIVLNVDLGIYQLLSLIYNSSKDKYFQKYGEHLD